MFAVKTERGEVYSHRNLSGESSLSPRRHIIELNTQQHMIKFSWKSFFNFPISFPYFYGKLSQLRVAASFYIAPIFHPRFQSAAIRLCKHFRTKTRSFLLKHFWNFTPLLLFLFLTQLNFGGRLRSQSVSQEVPSHDWNPEKTILFCSLLNYSFAILFSGSFYCNNWLIPPKWAEKRVFY